MIALLRRTIVAPLIVRTIAAPIALRPAADGPSPDYAPTVRVCSWPAQRLQRFSARSKLLRLFQGKNRAVAVAQGPATPAPTEPALPVRIPLARAGRPPTRGRPAPDRPPPLLRRSPGPPGRRGRSRFGVSTRGVAPGAAPAALPQATAVLPRARSRSGRG